MRNKNFITAALVMAAVLTGCGASSTNVAPQRTGTDTVAVTDSPQSVQTETNQAEANQTDTTQENTDDEALAELPNIYLRLGETQDRPSFEITLEDNEVSVRFVRILQDYTRVIPLYVFDGSENTDVLQYYDIPSGYNIPDGTPERVTSEKAGEVYYSAGRIMIFYKDAEIEGNYVKIGETLTTEGLEDAVNSNPLDDWGNKRVTIGIME